MDPQEKPEIDLDFSGDADAHVPDSHLSKRFPVTNALAAEIEIDTEKAA